MVLLSEPCAWSREPLKLPRLARAGTEKLLRVKALEEPEVIEIDVGQLRRRSSRAPGLKSSRKRMKKALF